MSADAAIVGVGCILPQGEGDAALDRVLAGHCAAEPWPEDGRFVVGRIPESLVRDDPRCDRAVTLALRAAESALADAGLLQVSSEEERLRPMLRDVIPSERVACLFALSKGGLDKLAAAWPGTRGDTFRDDDWVMGVDPAAALRQIAARFGLRGPMLTPVSACASGGHVLARARWLLLDGRADVVLCGAADAPLMPLVLESYERLGLLAPSRDRPQDVCRPFAVDRCGFFVGEGAAAFVLTSPETARRLGLGVRARLAGCAEGAFATSLVTVPTDGRDLAYAMGLAMERAGIGPRDVDLVAVHGTATRDGDLNEARAVGLALADHSRRVRVLATKPLHGHLLGAACAVESALVVRALETGRLPPVACGAGIDPQCSLGCGGAAPAAVALRTAVKLSAGFGGQISVNVFRSA